LLAGRAAEIETFNGAIMAYGAELGIDTPVTRTLRDLVCLVDRPASVAPAPTD